MTPSPALKTVGVMGSASEEHAELAEPLGQLLARLGVNLLTGGGRGVMTAVSRVFTQASRSRGICIGIIPCASLTDRATPKAGYPNPYVELPIFTHLPLSGEQGTDDLSRNHINILSSTAIVALPGGAGTASEAALALRYGKPIVAYSTNDSLIAHFPAGVKRVSAIGEVELFLRNYLD